MTLLPDNTLPFDRIYEALESHRQMMERLRGEGRELQSEIVELRRQLDMAASTLESAFNLTHRSAPLQHVVEEVIRATEVRSSDMTAEIERQRIDLGVAASRIRDLEADARAAVDGLTKAVELPPNRVRSLGSAVAETVTLVQEAKRMVQENL